MHMSTARLRLLAFLFVAASMLPALAQADTLKVLTAGAFKQVLLATLPQFESAGHQVQWEADTVGGLAKRIEAGEAFDLVFASSAILDRLNASGKVERRVDLARVGVGVAVKEGAAKPPIGTVEDFKKMLLASKHIAYIDPASGGTSGIYIAGLLDRLGVGDQIRPKSVLVNGGFSADRVVSGEADVAIQQISELLPVKGVSLVGPLPPEIQSYTVYAGALAATSAHKPAAQALIDLLRSPAGEAAVSAKGMEPVPVTTPSK
jgi:molybdate transport system substrate-binding protein